MRISTGRNTFSRSIMTNLGWRPSSSVEETTSSSNHAKDMKDNNIIGGFPQDSKDEMFLRLRREAAKVVQNEPILCMLLTKVGLLDASTQPKQYPMNTNNAKIEPAKSFEEAIARIVAHRISSCSGGTENICPKFLRSLLEESFLKTDELEMGHTMSYAVREDAMAVLNRDPACETLLEAVLFMKGFHSLVLHRAARRAWKPSPSTETMDGEKAEGGNDINGAANADMEQAKESVHSSISVSGQRFVALLLQSQASSAFGVDIHPASSIGAGVMIDHASGVVIGETATVGDGTTILHGVTLGGTGKDHGDRHPKIGKDVLIGAGTKILGNITVGDRAKIGAGSVVLRPIPSGATAVGAPAKIIGFIPKNELPGRDIDMKLEGVEPLLGKKISSSITEGTTESSSASLATEATQEEVAATKKKEEKTKVVAGEGDTVASTSNEEGEEDSDEKEEASGTDDSEEDDNITDYGTTPKCRWVKISNHNDGLCPFSGSFRHVSSALKENSISHSELRALLIQEGCSEGECVEVFFELLHCTPATSNARQCGCIPLDIFSKCFPEIAKEKIKHLDEGTIEALAKGDLRALGMSKKASRRFKSMFNMLGKKVSSSGHLPRISSSGLSSSATSIHSGEFSGIEGIRKSERERMTVHLDTTGFQEGISI